jgi:hypothetical protein
MTASNTPADAVQPIGGADGYQPDLRRKIDGVTSTGEPLTDEQVRLYLSDCADFLRQIARITAAVVETIGIGQVRQIVAEEIPVAYGVIGEDGVLHPTEMPARSDHRKNPRGRKHPVIALLQMGLQSVRLLQKIVYGTNPNALNAETLEQKKAREEAAEAERTFKALLRG